ncbi:PREDICTED: type IV inositol polyphosphate 5-phosphatase 3-like isoform X2 [Ipomoea nil]|uniref:type IV inositol polyphosphate 5-phosphatase 3-like isoform X2 n=1 Tax=Ipomoea nil TaxID=35883 RepID=UPI000901DB84|nr:PREDICTED: type IV inositol polyphosphate 5-phosphatase 3-like isoform X2 [Ipomoea nil]
MQRSWAEILCFGCTCLQLFWPRVVVRKLLNISAQDSDYSADTQSDSDSDSHSDSDRDQDVCEWPRQSRFKDARGGEVEREAAANEEAVLRTRRRKSETFRAQYINTKEIRVCAGTWNVGGKVPPDDLDLDGWLDIDVPADIYVLGFQEIIPLNAGNIFGAEDNRPIPKWENIIRETLNKIPPVDKFKSYSEPSSPSRFKPSEGFPDIEEEIALEFDSDGEEEIVPLNEECNEFVEANNITMSGNDTVVNADVSASSGGHELTMPIKVGVERQFSSPKRLDRLNCLRTEESEENVEEMNIHYDKKLTKMLSGTEKIGLSWPETPLDLLPQCVLERPNSFKSRKSFKASLSIGAYGSFKSTTYGQNRTQSDVASLAKMDLESLINRKRRPSYVRIISKQMVGIFLTIWVRRSLRKHIQNLNVSTVGVGVMGYIGNKGSISVSMSIYQTFFCFICTHLTSGDKDADAVKRNADVLEIHRRTHFNTYSSTGLPKSINDHERIIWLGDLNYRINLSYEKTRELISKKDWPKLIENDQLSREFKKGHVFDGWSEGILKFPPTYKYEINSDKYHGEDPRAGRRTPAWCDRILSYGKGMRLLSYRRSELQLSDHRPVTATYMVEVEIFSARKLQRALTYTDAEIENEEVVTDIGTDCRMSRLMTEEDALLWGR